jgi:hypothetical protein
MSYWWSRSFGLCRLPPERLVVTWVEAGFTVVSVTVVSITVLLVTATFSTTIVFSLIAASITAFSDRGSSSGGSDTLIRITGILTIHTILTRTMVISHL